MEPVEVEYLSGEVKSRGEAIALRICVLGGWFGPPIIRYFLLSMFVLFPAMGLGNESMQFTKLFWYSAFWGVCVSIGLLISVAPSLAKWYLKQYSWKVGTFIDYPD